MSSKIKILPEHLINQIKAGEIAEAPSAILKELLENSLDANATKIDLQLIDNGIGLIAISDNGDGMNFSDLPYAFCPHATSKIEKFDDLFSLHSFGFRGEALASISSISRLTLSSTPKYSREDGGKIIIHGGKQISHELLKGADLGTSIFIKDLFYNTPVRLNFIKSKNQEKNALTKVINAFLIANPKISFSIKWDNLDKQTFMGGKNRDDELNRIYKLFFRNKNRVKNNSLNSHLIMELNEYEDIKLKTFVSLAATGGARLQYLFINNRYFKDSKIHRIITKQMESIWGPGRSGHYILKIVTPPKNIDINVHPNKTEIKFLNYSDLLALISASIKSIALKHRPINNQNLTDEKKNEANNPASNNNFSYPNFNFNGQNLEPFNATQNNKHLFLINSKYALLKKGDEENEMFIVNINKALSIFYSHNFNKFQKSITPTENDLTPLLVVPPFEISNTMIDSLFTQLKEYGLEFDRISKTTIILRTIPSFMDNFYTKELIDALLQFLSASDKLFFLDFFDNENNMEKIKSNSTQLTQIIDQFNNEELLRNGAICHFNNSVIGNLFTP